LETIKKAD